MRKSAEGFLGSEPPHEYTGSTRATSDAASELSSPGISPRDAAALRASLPEPISTRGHQMQNSRPHVGRPRQRSDPTRTRSRQSPAPPAPRGHATPDAELSQVDFLGAAVPMPPPPSMAVPCAEGLSIQAMYERIRQLEEQFVVEGGTQAVRHWTVDQITAETDILERTRPPAPDAERMCKSVSSSPPGVSKSPPREILDIEQMGGYSAIQTMLDGSIASLAPEYGSDYCSDDSGSMPSSPRSARSVGSGSGSAFGSVARKSKPIGRSRKGSVGEQIRGGSSGGGKSSRR